MSAFQQPSAVGKALMTYHFLCPESPMIIVDVVVFSSWNHKAEVFVSLTE